MTETLTGTELLSKVKELGNVGKHELARACGYTSPKSNGGERTNFSAFYAALLEAKGIHLNDQNNAAQRGKMPSYRTTVHFNGNLLVGKAYVLTAGFQPGDEFEIKVGKNGFRLIPVNQSDEVDNAEFSD